MADFARLFHDYGADYDVTMGRFMGNETLYLRLLDMLPQDDNLSRLGDALSAGDLDAAFEAAHTLKGVAGNLGLTPLCEAVCGIVEPLRRREDIDYAPMYRVVLAEFERAELFRRQLKEAR